MLNAGTDSGKVADIVESVLAEATREQEEIDRQQLAEVEAAARGEARTPARRFPSRDLQLRGQDAQPEDAEGRWGRQFVDRNKRRKRYQNDEKCRALGGLNKDPLVWRPKGGGDENG